MKVAAVGSWVWGRVRAVARGIWGGRAVGLVTVLVILWGVGVLVWFYQQDSRTTSDCTDGMREIQTENQDGTGSAGDDGGDEGDGAEAVVLATAGEGPTSFDFTTRRDAQTRILPLAGEGEIPDDIEDAQVVVEGFGGPGGTPAVDLVYDLRQVGSRLMLDICIDSRPLKVTSETEAVDRKAAPGVLDWLRGTSNTRPGTYTTNVHIVHDRVTAEAIPIQVRFQARYIWLLAPLIPIMPIIAILAVYKATPPKDWAFVYVPVLGATAVAFNAQALSDPAWGGLTAAFGLFGITFTAAVGAATLAARAPAPDAPPGAPAQEPGKPEDPDEG